MAGWMDSIPDPPDTSTIRLQRSAEEIVIVGMGPSQEQPFSLPLLQGARTYLKFAGCMMYAFMLGGVVSIAFIIVVVFTAEGPRGPKIGLLLGAAVFAMIWFGLLYRFLRSTNRALESSKLFTLKDESPAWRIVMKPDALALFSFDTMLGLECDRRSLHGLEITEDNRVVGQAFDSKTGRFLQVEFSGPLTHENAAWLHEILS